MRAGALTLARSAQYLCPGVVLAVVDPGVGTERRAHRGRGRRAAMSVLVGPDNGLLAPAVAMVGGATARGRADQPRLPPARRPGRPSPGATSSPPPRPTSATGVDLAELGRPIDPSGLLPGMLPLSHLDEDGALMAEVLWVDRYGNAQLNVDPDDVEAFGDAAPAHRRDVPHRSSGATSTTVGPGEVGLVVDSYGLLSVVLDQSFGAPTELELRRAPPCSSKRSTTAPGGRRRESVVTAVRRVAVASPTDGEPS